MNDNIDNALSIIAKECLECLNHNEISKCIEIEYCYNTIAIECDVDKRMYVHGEKKTGKWVLSILTRDEYYKAIVL